jgi:membrane protein YdbS with pleckstrin-like domain
MSGRAERAAAWIYRGIWSTLVNLFKVPAEPPTLPVRRGEFIRSFQPSIGFLRYLKFWFWLVLFLTDIAFAIGYVAAAAALCLAGLWWVSLLLLPVALFLIIAPDIVAYIAIHLRYDTTWYVMTDRSLRVRRGVWSIHEVTITFENVQNISVKQGPVERYFGIADVMVQTAGGAGACAGGGKGGHAQALGHTGVIEGIDNAPEIRDLILARLRESKSAGLGDEDRTSPRAVSQAPSIWRPEHLAALREIRDAARALASPS